MAYTPTLADIKALDAQDANNASQGGAPQAPASAGYTPTVADIQALDAQNAGAAPQPAQAPQQYSLMHNIAAGFDNPWVHMANMAPGVNMPSYPHSGTWGYTLGNLASLAAPFGAAEKGLTLSGEAAARALPLLEKIPGAITRMARIGTAGAATGGATAPPGERGESAGLGAALGAAGGAAEGLMRIPKKVLHHLAEQTGRHIIEPLHTVFNENIQRLMPVSARQVLGNAYHKARAAVDWKDTARLARVADKQRGSATPGMATPNYQRMLQAVQTHALKEIKKPGVRKNVVLTQNLDKLDHPINGFGDALNLKPLINRIADWSPDNSTPENNLLQRYSGMLGNALDTDVERGANTPEAHDFLRNWQEARADHAHLQSFYIDPETGKMSGRLRNELEGGDFKKALQRYVPTKHQEMSKISLFRSLIPNSDHADEALLNQGLQPYLSRTPVTGASSEIDALKLSRALHQGKFPDSLQNLLTPTEQSLLGNMKYADTIRNNLRGSKGIIKRVSERPLLGSAAGYMLAHHLGFGPGGELLSSMGGLALPEHLESSIAKRYQQKGLDWIRKGQLHKLKHLVEPLEDGDKDAAWRGYYKNAARLGAYGGALSPVVAPAEPRADAVSQLGVPPSPGGG